MNITKYEHACLLLEIDNQRLVVDPGSFSVSLGAPDHVVAVVVTHVHPDHFDPLHLKQLYNANPELQIFTVAPVAEQLGDLPVVVVAPGDEVTAGPFQLRFYGGQHAVIHESYPLTENVGVMVNDTLYYPGDSLVEPDGHSVPALALPVNAPWLKMSEAIDMVLAIKPRRVFPTHNVFLSEAGQQLADRLVGQTAASVGSEYTPLSVGKSINV